ncbi:hypothetical protein [Klebsiella pneumoniae]|uniref:hypothetical protein n=1 Tax=Klebsiella pneumoniae TaxID=573 RepID=UPI003A5CB06E
MTSKLTREQLHERARENVKALKMASRQTTFQSAREEILADLQLAELALAAMDSKPVFFIEVEGDDWINAGRIEGKNRQDLGLLPDGINYLYAAPQPPTDAEREELQERRKAAAKTITLPAPACTYADHSYPAYTEQQVLTMLESLGVTVVEEDV